MRSFPKAIRLLLVLLVATLMLAACGDDDDGGDTGEAGESKGSLSIGGSDFTEQDIVANIYAEALRKEGYDVTVKPRLGKRETAQPALQNGDIDLMAEYVGSLLEFLQPGSASPDLSASLVKLRGLLQPKGLTALDAAGAFDANALVVTSETATERKLTKISDLTPVASQLVMGGPPECPTRPLCLVGYKEKYGLNFKEFKPLDVAGPVTKKALTDGDIDVALLLSSDVPADTVILEDDKGLQPAENLVPVIRADKVTDEIRNILNEVSEKLTLGELVELNQKAAGDDKPDPADLAKDWVEEYIT